MSQQASGFLSGILYKSCDRHNYPLAYITNEDNSKYLPPKVFPLLFYRGKKCDEAVKADAIYLFSLFPSCLTEKYNLKAQLEKFQIFLLMPSLGGGEGRGNHGKSKVDIRRIINSL